MNRAVAALLAAAALAGCVTYTGGPKKLLKPEGETVTVRPSKGVAVTGEILGLRGEELILARDGRLTALRLADVPKVEVAGYPSLKTADRGKLLLYARYPQGLDEGQWQLLLRESGQQDFDRLP